MTASVSSTIVHRNLYSTDRLYSKTYCSLKLSMPTNKSNQVDSYRCKNEIRISSYLWRAFIICFSFWERFKLSFFIHRSWEHVFFILWIWTVYAKSNSIFCNQTSSRAPLTALLPELSKDSDCRLPYKFLHPAKLFPEWAQLGKQRLSLWIFFTTLSAISLF